MHWEPLHPLLPPQTPTTGRPAVDHRRLLKGLVWMLRTGAPWHEVPERYGPGRTVASRFSRGQTAGVFPPVLEALPQPAATAGQRDWPAHAVDRTSGRGQNSAAATDAFGRSPGGFRTQVHLRAAGAGQRLTLIVTPGQRHDAVCFPHLLAPGAVKRSPWGRPQHRPRRIVGDKASSRRQIRPYVRRHGRRSALPRTVNAQQTGPFDRTISRQQNTGARLIDRSKPFHRLATREEKRAAN